MMDENFSMTDLFKELGEMESRPWWHRDRWRLRWWSLTEPIVVRWWKFRERRDGSDGRSR